MGTVWRAAVLLFAWAGAAALAFLQGGYASWFLLEALSFLLIFGIGVRCGALRRLEAQHHLSAARITAGEELTVTVQLRQRSLFPVPWLFVEEEWSRLGEPAPRLVRRLLFPWFRSSVVYRHAWNGLPRGEYRLVRLKAAAGDGLGFMKREVTAILPQRTAFLVLPAELPIRLGMASAGPEDGRPRFGASRLGGFPSGIRNYAAGDPLSRIHWKASAKRGALAVKQGEPQEARRILTLLDSSAAAAAASGEAGEPLLEASVQAAAGLLRESRSAGWTFGFACCHAGAYRSGQAPLRDGAMVLELLARIDGQGVLRFPDLVSGEAAAAAADTLLALVTWHLDDELLAALRGLQRRQRSVLLVYPHLGPAPSLRERERLSAFREAGCTVIAIAALRSGGRAERADNEPQGGAADVSA